MKLMKKFSALLLAIIMLLSASCIALAAEKPVRDCPEIYIPGFYASDIYADVNDPDSLLTLPDKDDIIALVNETVIPALTRYSVLQDTDALATEICSAVNNLFDDWFNESTGDAKDNSGVIFPMPESVSSTAKLVFRYDWRGNPIEIADRLNDYINTVLDLSNCEKVTLGCHSLGSTVALAYLNKYGNSKVSSIVFDSPACNGVGFVGNLLTGKVTLDAEAVAYFTKTMIGESEYEDLISSIIDVFEIADIPELFTLFIDEIIEELSPAVYRETIAPLFACWPTMWAMVPDSQTDEAKAYIFDNVLKGQDFTVLEEKINLYNSTVRATRYDVLKSFDAVGKFAIISRYGSPAFPLTGSSDIIGDTVIETSLTSFGATTAPLGDYFSDSYLAGKNAAYISPDKTVDASTCLFPEKTWFIKNTNHFETDEFSRKYYDVFLYANEELTCETSDFGRFSYCNKTDFTITKDTSEPEKIEKTTLWKKVFNFLTALFERFTTWLINLFTE